LAAQAGHASVVRLLLEAAPGTALMVTRLNATPLEVALSSWRVGALAAASILLQEGPSPLPPTSKLLRCIAERVGQQAYPLYPLLIARQLLTAAEWALLPTPCLGLGTALPAVVDRSAAEAGLLVGHLPSADRQRLRNAALCLARAQRAVRVPLPSPIMSRILALSAA